MADRPEPFAFAQKDVFFALRKTSVRSTLACDTPEARRYQARFRDNDVPFGI